MSAKSGFLSSVGALSAARAAAMAGQILVLPILSRQLTPAEFGVAALAVSVAAFANLFSDAGMGRSLIRTPLERMDEWSSVFWFLSAVGLGLTAILATLAPAAAFFFEEPALLAPLLVLAPLPFILAMNAPFSAEMEQRGAFAELALSQTVATVAALATTVVMALAGFGVWALVAQQIVQLGLRAVWVATRSFFRPGFRFSRTALGVHFIFGRDVTAASLIGYVSDQSTTIVVGKVLGVADLGLFSMVQRFARLPMFGMAGPFGQVLYVKLIRSVEDKVAFRHVVLSSMRVLCLASLPPMVALAVVGETAFSLVLSDRWALIAPIFAAIAIGAGLRCAIYPTTIALTALGMTGSRLRLTVEIAIFWLVLLIGSVSFGLVATATAQSIWMVTQTPRHWVRLKEACDLGAADFLHALAPGFATATAVAIVLFAARSLTLLEGWSWLACAAGLSIMVFGVAVLVLMRALRADFTRLRN